MQIDIDGSTNVDGVPWWRVAGTTRRIAAYLWFNVALGDTFTMAQARRAAEIEHQTQSDRRMRELREQGWVVEGYKDDSSLPMDTYRLVAKGQKLWLGEKLERDVISNKLRRQVFERDGNTCVICGVRTGEEYPDMPGEKARITVGHRVPNQRLGEATMENLQTECSRCNETVRNMLDDPERFEEVIPLLESLDWSMVRELSVWLEDGRRTPFPVDIAYSRIRKLNHVDQERAAAYIRDILLELDEY